MLFELFGVIAFALYALYDLNSALWKKTWLRCFFALGSVLIAFSTGMCLWKERASFLARSGLIYVWLLLIVAAACFILLVYSLFFALPFQKTYVQENAGAFVCDKGMYALCRHPGVLWLSLLYASLALAWNANAVWRIGILFTVLDFLYVCFQDRWTFMHTFVDYADYRERVPFLIPNRKSVTKALKTYDE